MTTPTTLDPVTLDPENPCVLCGAPTIRGLNTDFCSEKCERQYEAQEQADMIAHDVVEAPADDATEADMDEALANVNCAYAAAYRVLRQDPTAINAATEAARKAVGA
jgi:predicted nucleic acid-binding Zn ribbon protein